MNLSDYVTLYFILWWRFQEKRKVCCKVAMQLYLSRSFSPLFVLLWIFPENNIAHIYSLPLPLCSRMLFHTQNPKGSTSTNVNDYRVVASILHRRNLLMLVILRSILKVICITFVLM